MRVGHAFLQTFASQLIQSTASLLTSVLIARGLGPLGQGQYALLVAAIGLLATIAAMGQFEGHVLTLAGSHRQGRVLLLRSIVQLVGVGALLALTQNLWRRWLG